MAAVAHNVRELVRRASGARVCAVVKANGYGHGAPEVARTALANGATWLAVATVEEGVELRDCGIGAPVLLLSEPPGDDLGEVVRQRITPTLYSSASIEALAATVGRLAVRRVDVHLKVDSGMHRVGASPSQFPELMTQVTKSGVLRLGGLWSHFAVADTDPRYTGGQIQTYLAAIQGLAGMTGVGGRHPLRHLANTPGILFHPESHLDMVRPGLGIYGLYPHPAAQDLIDLRPAMRVISHVCHLVRHPAGTRPSYGRIRPLSTSSTVVTLPVGYADGIPRLLSNGGEVLIGGRRFPLAGRVTMDQLMVETGDHPVSVGDQAVLVGKQGKESISFDEWAGLSDTISYEVVSRIGPRLPKRYIS